MLVEVVSDKLLKIVLFIKLPYGAGIVFKGGDDGANILGREIFKSLDLGSCDVCGFSCLLSFLLCKLLSTAT